MLLAPTNLRVCPPNVATSGGKTNQQRVPHISPVFGEMWVNAPGAHKSPGVSPKRGDLWWEDKPTEGAPYLARFWRDVGECSWRPQISGCVPPTWRPLVGRQTNRGCPISRPFLA